jgi:hypothetical protein
VDIIGREHTFDVQPEQVILALETWLLFEGGAEQAGS